jgi:hypothetical protein
MQHINPTPILHHHLRYTTKYLINLHLITNSPTTHRHFRNNLAPQIPKVCWPTTYNLHLGPDITEPYHHPNTMVKPVPPGKFLMCYEAAIASTDGDEATIVKSLIISLEDVATNWYSRLPPKCIYF